MTIPYMFLTLIIPRPHNPKSRIDVYLKSLIKELKILWSDGIPTNDASKQHNFMLNAALIQIINDFPMYGILFGWYTAKILACPICMNDTRAFTLKHRGKQSWFDYHKCFLHIDHIQRRNKDGFYKNKIDRSLPPQILTSDEVW